MLDKNTPAMDMYSMGIVFFELATLKYPFDINTTGDQVEAFKNAHLTKVPQNPSTLNPSLDTNLAQLIMKMVSKRPENRYQNWDDVLERISSPDGSIEQSNNIPGLVRYALESHQQAERERLEQVERERQRREYEDIIATCFREIVEDAQIIVDEFNHASDFMNLEIRLLPRFSFDIMRSHSNERLVVSIVPVHEDFEIDNRKIKAWGFAKAPSGRGFNLLLVEQGPEDIYGEWITFQVSHSAIARGGDNRPEPFPFEINEFPREIQFLRAMHIYNVNQGKYHSDLLLPLIQELLT